jgi:hypothetical protein
VPAAGAVSDQGREGGAADDVIRRRSGLLCLAAFLLATPARAEDDPCTEVGDKVVCTHVGFDVLLDSYAELEHRATSPRRMRRPRGRRSRRRTSASQPSMPSSRSQR